MNRFLSVDLAEERIERIQKVSSNNISSETPDLCPVCNEPLPSCDGSCERCEGCAIFSINASITQNSGEDFDHSTSTCEASLHRRCLKGFKMRRIFEFVEFIDNSPQKNQCSKRDSVGLERF